MEGGGVLILASAADLQALVGVFLPQQRLPGNQPGKGWNWGDRNRGGPGEGLTGDFKVEQAINRGTSVLCKLAQRLHPWDGMSAWRRKAVSFP